MTSEYTYIPSRVCLLSENDAGLIVAPLRQRGFSHRQFNVWLESQAYGERSLRLLYRMFNALGEDNQSKG